MKKKAECEARESLQPADCANISDSVSSAASVTDDARELIEAMQNAAAQPSSLVAGTEKSQKSRARRLTSTTVALDDVSKPEAGSLGDGTGEDFCGCCECSVSLWCVFLQIF